MPPIFIVACSSRKATVYGSSPVPAVHLYTGRNFRACREALRSEAWFILSGKYGLIHNQTRIEAYDQPLSLADVRANPAKYTRWLSRSERLHLMTTRRVIVLGGIVYAAAAKALLRRPVEAPLLGLAIGQQYQKITAPGWINSLVGTPNAS